MKTFILYSTVGCHLCEQAMDLLRPLLTDEHQIKEIDISDSESLMEKYGVRIPVIASDDSQDEIGWPFDQQQLIEFLR